MQVGAKAYVKAYDKCQCYNNVPRRPSKYPTPMVAPWPFAQWGLDILEPFSHEDKANEVFSGRDWLFY